MSSFRRRLFDDSRIQGSCSIKRRRRHDAHSLTDRGGERRVEPDPLSKIWILRKLPHPMNELSTMEFMLDTMKSTRPNDEFFNSMKR